jgi:hypothetical protein
MIHMRAVKAGGGVNCVCGRTVLLIPDAARRRQPLPARQSHGRCHSGSGGPQPQLPSATATATQTHKRYYLHKCKPASPPPQQHCAGCSCLQTPPLHRRTSRQHWQNTTTQYKKAAGLINSTLTRVSTTAHNRVPHLASRAQCARCRVLPSTARKALDLQQHQS